MNLTGIEYDGVDWLNAFRNQEWFNLTRDDFSLFAQNSALSWLSVVLLIGWRFEMRFES
jgi:hypothetical protein